MYVLTKRFFTCKTMSDECFEGTLDWNQFLRSVDQLSAISAKVDDNWIRREVSSATHRLSPPFCASREKY
ncbi:unnamed protein product [Medioppia subpectinata]|uniref:Uncharacterized protein n=1 Tax=Medioppia subpectinata TaxID=1979941 RepID=A0A7R9KI67_9ACAR|nr:unnamed protein product [Medioppia subpectinata]CAG2104145.1 unnamed protein product [Medioppia subpectinata]